MEKKSCKQKNRERRENNIAKLVAETGPVVPTFITTIENGHMVTIGVAYIEYTGDLGVCPFNV